MRVINGVDLIIQDQGCVATFECSTSGCTGDPFAPNMPLIAAGIPARSASPASASGSRTRQRAYVDIAIAPPILMPAGSDVFVGFALPP